MKDVFRFINGRAYKKEELLTKGKYRVLRVGNFFTNNEWYYSDLELSEEKYCNKGDLLYAWSASFGPQIWEGDKTIFHYHIWNVDYSKKNLFREYLFYFLLFDKTQVLKSTTGSTMIHVSMENMNPRLIPIPPLKEQKRIASQIETLLPLIDIYESQKYAFDLINSSIAENLHKSILQEAIQGRLVPQIDSEGTAEELLEEIREDKMRLVKEGKLKRSAIANESRIFRGDDNKYYEQIGSKVIDIDEEIPFAIPYSWRWIRLGYVIDFSSNSSVKSENIHQDSWILDLEDIEKDSGNLLRRKKMSESNAKSDKHIFFAGNILYSKLRPYLNKVLIADMDGFCTSEILAFDFGKINSEYALAYLRSSFFVEYAMSDAYGVKMPRLGSKQGNNALMPIPPMAEQQRIVSRIKQLMSHLV